MMPLEASRVSCVLRCGGHGILRFFKAAIASAHAPPVLLKRGKCLGPARPLESVP